MTPHETCQRLEWRLLVTAAVIACMPLFAAAAAAQSTSTQAFTDPAHIDHAVAKFTGVPIGETGGARVPADRRLRLATCASPLDVAWHGQNRSTLRVSCAGPQSWRIFIATRAPQQAEQSAPTVNRGDPITVIVRGRGFTVQQSGEAMENGAAGDWIAIRTAREASPIRARIERPGLAIIPAN